MRKIQIKRIIYSLCVVVSTSIICYGQPIENGLNAITLNSIKGQMCFLTSDYTRGREAGTDGDYLSSEYIASIFSTYNIAPLGDIEKVNIYVDENKLMHKDTIRSYFQNFNLIKYRATNNQRFGIKETNEDFSKSHDFQYLTDFSVNPGGINISVEAPIVFVGYGINDTVYNDFKKINAVGKILIRLKHYPGYADSTSKGFAYFSKIQEWMLNENKDRWAKEAGAIAVIEVSNDMNVPDTWVKNQPPYFGMDPKSIAKSSANYYSYTRIPLEDSIPTTVTSIRVSNRAGKLILDNEGINIQQFEANCGSNLLPISKTLTKKGFFKTEVESAIVKVRNVIGVIEGVDKEDCIVVGGHYDHLGYYGGEIYRGADDNASGTIGVLSIAKAFSAMGTKPKKTIIFAAWTAEECGLFGSENFIKKFPSTQKVVLNLNLDMIGRSTVKDTLKNGCMFIYSSNWEGFRDMTDDLNKLYNINLDIRYKALIESTGGSDHTTFFNRGIPIQYFFGGMHKDYHLPTDVVSEIDFEKMQKIIKLSFLNIEHCSNSDMDVLNFKNSFPMIQH